ncbi:MAG: pectate lyase [Sphaerochaetaceae bacterium]|jgi:hypothetical protein|nr:fibronectin type III domain-containing protein [Sphaerochaetaceae bacterium]NLO59683.1 fibronectin type III domain-containing protein [Spirochaetales bacterium]MDD3669759.1 pectate lyase [Sphaerochaetaceae bacterium]MDD4259049.1 pectate lyase [Sphaerochaetaceae bacterium]MDD4841256.1 pectate lyase [Sphaerochaetaceae bacterium]
MMKVNRFVLFALMLLLISTTVVAQEMRPAWASVEPPKIISIEANANNLKRVAISFDLETSTEGADSAVVKILDAMGRELETRPVGKSKRLTKKIEFEIDQSGTYLFQVFGYRKDEQHPVVSQQMPYQFTYPLEMPVVAVLNRGNGTLGITWNPVKEAQSYELEIRNLNDANVLKHTDLHETEYVISSLIIDERYEIVVCALRNGERVSSLPFIKTVRQHEERTWNFTYFGQSTTSDLNRMVMIDSDNLEFKLYSCSYFPDSMQTDQKGGKFTAFHDGISYYYTIINPNTENFELTATFEIDYINPVADGQEGFGLLAMDSLGQHGINSINHYTNSAGIIATKFEEVIGGVKKTSKDTLGARFVTQITKEMLGQGDSMIAQNGRSVSHAFSYDQADLVKSGDVYTVKLKKTNTGYHAIFETPYATEETITEYILYGTDKLQVIEPDRVYVGCAVARGCNATIRDVSFIVTDAKTDLPAEPEPPQLIPLEAKVDSPSTYSYASYPFVFSANADGILKVIDSDRKVLVNDAKITAFEDYKANLTLEKGINDYQVTFTPDAQYKPGENQVIARYDRDLAKYVENYQPFNIQFTAIHLTYPGQILYAGPNGSPFGNGSRNSPLDLQSALNYVMPGQKVVLLEGTYYPTRTVMIERGNDGKQGLPKMVGADTGSRPVLDFGNGTAQGMQLWGDWWEIDGFDITNTQGNIKGLQIAGDHNVIRNIRTYRCGDTGIQISGTSTEGPDKWPSFNRIESCVSFDNCDPAANNADGFAAKLTSGEGNVFSHCIGYSNIDDGWDLYTKIDSGPIGAVLIDSCVACKNGSLSDGSGNGDGNGFKLGGDGISVEHILRNSIAYANGAVGITSNSNPAIIIDSCTSFGNLGSNVALYGKGDGQRYFKVTNILSMQGQIGDNFREMPSLVSMDNYFWDGAASRNASGHVLTPDVFLSTDMTRMPTVGSEGKIDMHDLFVLKPTIRIDSGARLE